MRPKILVTADRRALEGLKPVPRIRPHRPEIWLAEAYVDVVRAAGGVPLVVPPGHEATDDLLAVADGIVLTGGDFDIHPSWYGEAVEGRLDRIEPGRTQLEIALAKAALVRGIPVLGICGGMQALAVAAGGRLIQDLPASGPVVHEQPTDPATGWHRVLIDSPARGWLGCEIFANSTHHQAVRDPGSGLVACGWSEDGVIEVIAGTGAFALGVQWHPELLGDLRAYEALVRASGRPRPE